MTNLFSKKSKKVNNKKINNDVKAYYIDCGRQCATNCDTSCSGSCIGGCKSILSKM